MINIESLSAHWGELLEHFRDEYELNNISYTTWIEKMRLGPIDGNIITVYTATDNANILSYYNKKYKEMLEAVISEEVNEICTVVFAVPGSDNQAAEQAMQEQNLRNESLERANLNKKYRFDTFVVGGNNKFAHSACLAVAETPGTVYNPLFLYGGAGLGKTHLMHSIGHYVLDQTPDKRVLYVTSESFTNEVIESIRSGNAASMSRLRDKYRTVDVLLIDDIQFIIGKEATQEEFFHTFNELHAAGKQIVLSSDRPPKEIVALEERFRSRFEMGLIADIQPPDYETRMAILRKNAEEQLHPVSNEVLEYIATNIKSNIRELEGAFNKIVAYSKLNNAEITPELAHIALRDIIDPTDAGQVTPKMIASVVCEQYNVRLSQVASRKKNAECVIPRQVIMYLCREYTDATLDAVAKLLEKKDHSTIMYGVEKIRKEMGTNEELRSNIDVIMKKLNLQSK